MLVEEEALWHRREMLEPGELGEIVMGTIHTCCLCHRPILPTEEFCFIEGRRLYVHTACQEAAAGGVGRRPPTKPQSPPPPSTRSTAA